MVRNTNGGGNAKRQARKHQGKKNEELVKSTCNLELYGVVTKMYGGNLCSVYTENGDNLRCHISGKFRNRNLRHNLIIVGTWVLVGLREWEKKIENCDLLYVYDKDDVEQLRNLPNINLRKILQAINQNDIMNTETVNAEDDDEFIGFEFSTGNSMSSTEINKIISGNVQNTINTDSSTVDIDDI